MDRKPLPIAIATLLAVLVGCAGRDVPVPDNIGYHQLRESFGDRDLTPLEGRRILLDPGHGGVFPGVVGLNGVSEAEVNLGVALWLRGLLEAAGAEVHMTRTADTDFLSPADSTLAADLAARSAICDSLAPDVFLSLHHNSNAALDRDLNETQTYYPVGRDGADLDLARAVHKHLVRNLEISPAKIMAGNFSVLRNATVPAVLGEPSMLSNPEVEKKLSAAGKQRLEAEAYFLGLLEYFEGGNPYWELVSDTTAWKGEPITWKFVPDSRMPESAHALDPTSVHLTLNGERVPANLDLSTQTVTWDRNERINQALGFRLLGRNLDGRSTPVAELDLTGALADIDLFSVYDSAPGQVGPCLLVWRGQNSREHGQTELFFDIDNGIPFLTMALAGPHYRAAKFTASNDWDGQSIDLLTAKGDTLRSIRTSIMNLARGSEVFWHVLTTPDGHQNFPDDHWQIRQHLGSEDWHILYKGWLDRGTIPAICSVRDHPAWLEIRGARPILVDATHRTPWQEPCDLPRDTLVWQPLVPELVGKTIVIDPHGGAADSDGTAPMGTPGRELNLRTAERLAALLRGCGAEAVLTRDDPGFVPPEAKVLMANEVEADLFITLRRAGPGMAGWSVAHHYGSRGGWSWGSLLAETLAPFAAPDTVPIAESYAYLLRHTACPAVEVSLPLPGDLETEERWRSPAYQQAVASALMSATAAWFEGEELLLSLTDPRTFIEERATRPTLIEGCDWIRVDGNWLWLPPRDTSTSAARLPLPGPDHTFEVRRGDRWELLLSAVRESERVSVWPFWTSERAPTNPFAETNATHEADAP